MATYRRPPDPRRGEGHPRRSGPGSPIPWLWIGIGFLVTLLAVWLAVWLVLTFLARDPLPVGGPPATIIRLTAPATAEATATSMAPTPTAIPTLAPSPTPDRGEVPEVVTAGFFATVVNTDGIGLSVRAGAGTANQILGVAPEGAVLRVLAGPAENDGFLWWQVALADGTEGWAVEQFLSPAPAPETWSGP